MTLSNVGSILATLASLGQSLDLEATLRLVMEQARDLMQADRSTLFMLSKETGELWSKVATADGEDFVEIRIPANRGIAGYVASTGQLLNIPDAYKDPRVDRTTDMRTGYVTRNILCMPVFNSGGDLIGVMQLINKHQGSFSSSDEEFMRAFNIQAGIALENAKLFENVLIEKQYQKDILQSLSHAVISTDMQGRIVTINEAALALLGCPPKQIDRNDRNRQLWEYKLTGRYVWEVVPIEHLQTLLQDSLITGSKHYVPEQSLTVGLFEVRRSEIEVNSGENHSHSSTYNPQLSYILAIRDHTNPNIYIPWNEPKLGLNTNSELPTQQVKELERTINLTINPLTNPEGGVRGGLVVLKDINQEKRMRTSFPNRMVSTDKASHLIAADESTKRLLSLSEEDRLEGQLLADANNEQQASPVSIGINDEKQLKSTNKDAISFPSLSSLRSAHSELLKHHRESGSTTELLAEIEEFIYRGRATGALLDTDEDRWASQSLLDYWSAILYRAGHEPPDATLAEFDSALAPELNDARCPYLGLEAFREEKSNLFYGRQSLLEKLVNYLKENRLLAVVGSSGSGKSSVVLGGLLPKLKVGALPGSENWHYYSPMVPGVNPLENLARLTQPRDVNATGWLQQQVENFQKDPNHLTKLSNEFGNKPCVLVVDQFEEVFTLCRDDSVRQAFIDNLIGLIQSPGVRHTVILTMRTDFESQVARVPVFKDLFEQAQVRVTALDASELREAIEKPAELVGLKFEEGLVEALLQDVLGEPAALPLLQFTLLKLWDNRERNRVTWETYKRLGGGRQALARSADEFYEQLILEEQVTVKRILLRMVRPTEGLEVTSNRIQRKTLYQAGEARDRVDRVLDKLIQSRLVRLSEGNTPDDAQVEVAHEALVRNWPRLVNWLEDERVNMRQRLRLTVAAEQWEAQGRDPSALLRGVLLNEALSYEDLNELESEFVQHSIKAERNSRRRTIGIVTGVIASLAGLVIFAFIQKDRAEKQLLEVQLLQKADQVNALLSKSPEDGLVTAIQITGQSQSKLGRVPTPIQDSLRKAIKVTLSKNQGSNQNFATSATFSPDGKIIATASGDGTVHLLDLKGEQLAKFKGHQGLVTSIRFSPDGQQLVTTGDDGTAQLWNFSGQQIAELKGHQGRIWRIRFSPDGQQLVTTGDDGTVRLWDLSGRQLAVLKGHQGGVSSVAFSPDGQLLATAGDDRTVRLWDLSGKLLAVLKGHQDDVSSVVFSPDGKSLATAGDDRTARLWDLSGRQLAVLKGHQGGVSSVAFSPDGKFIATAGDDGTVRLWSLSGKLLAVLKGHQDLVGSVIFSPDGKLIATASVDGTISLWDLQGRLLKRLNNSGSSISSVEFSPDGKTIVSNSRDGTTRLWDLQSNSIREVSQGEDWKTLLKFACNGLRDRSVFVNPQNNTAREAKSTCQKYVWNTN
jgi:WD40 repeat protein/GAF domain-containing protein